MSSTLKGLGALEKHVYGDPLPHGMNRLHSAALRGDKEVILSEVRSGVPIDVKDGFGSTPLHYAAASGNSEIINFVLDRGADVSAVNDYGQKPLDVAPTEAARETIRSRSRAVPISSVQRF